MSYDEIKLDYDLAEQMASIFRESAEQLQDVMQVMQEVATTIEDGALLGRGGNAYLEAIRTKLTPSISRLTTKMNELDEDVKAAINAMREADEKARGLMSN